MICQVLKGRYMQRCGHCLDVLRCRVTWRGQHLGDYSLCPFHRWLIANNHRDVKLISLELGEVIQTLPTERGGWITSTLRLTSGAPQENVRTA